MQVHMFNSLFVVSPMMFAGGSPLVPCSSNWAVHFMGPTVGAHDELGLVKLVGIIRFA